MLTVFYFLLSVAILIVVHEAGHFLVARALGVKVLQFSLGFGKTIFSYKTKAQTEFSLNLIPLGGYVKMLDENEGEVPLNLRASAFNNKPLWAKTLIVLAGPLFNFLLAIVALWLMWVIGFKALAPMIDEVKPHSIFSASGIRGNSEIIALDNEKINSWNDFQFVIMPYLGKDSTKIPITTRSLSDQTLSNNVLHLKNWQFDPINLDFLASLGIVAKMPKLEPIIGEVLPNSPAFGAGIQVGDEIISIDGNKISDWLKMVNYVRERAHKNIILVIQRDNKLLSIDVKVGEGDFKGKSIGVLGIKSKDLKIPANFIKIQQKPLLAAFEKAIEQTYQFSKITLIFLKRLVVGELSIQTISGPIGIAEAAKVSADEGLSYYLSFLAMVSISLGILNLLPIPILDGGHLLYYLIESLLGKPLSLQVKSYSMILGLVLLFMITIIAISNDITRLLN